MMSCTQVKIKLQEEAEPLIVGDCTVTVLVHCLEAGVPLLLGLERSRQAESLLVRRRDRDHRRKLVARHLAIAVGIRSLEALPAEPVDLLVALRSSVSHLFAVGNEGVLVGLVKGSW